jgi:hypothetical protein
LFLAFAKRPAVANRQTQAEILIIGPRVASLCTSAANGRIRRRARADACFVSQNVAACRRYEPADMSREEKSRHLKETYHFVSLEPRFQFKRNQGTRFRAHSFQNSYAVLPVNSNRPTLRRFPCAS